MRCFSCACLATLATVATLEGCTALNPSSLSFKHSSFATGARLKGLGLGSDVDTEEGQGEFGLFGFRPNKRRLRSSDTVMILERLSSSGVAALVQSQDAAAKLSAQKVDPIALLIGIAETCASDEKAQSDLGLVELGKILRERGLQPRGGLLTKAKEWTNAGPIGLKERFNLVARATNSELPFSVESKKSMEFAAKFEGSSSTTIHPEHVLVGLFQVNDAPSDLGQFVRFVVEDDFEHQQFSQLLGDKINDKVFENARTATDTKELATGGAPISTPTLKECATDMTEAAEKGELDKVIGRDKEVCAPPP